MSRNPDNHPRALREAMTCSAIQRAIRPPSFEAMDAVSRVFKNDVCSSRLLVADASSGLRSAMTADSAASQLVDATRGLRTALEPYTIARSISSPLTTAISTTAVAPSCLHDLFAATRLADSAVRMAHQTQSVIARSGIAFESVLGIRRFGSLATLGWEDLLEDEALDDLELPGEHRETIIRADRLPLAVLQRVLADPRHMLRLGSRDFEYFIADLLEKLGFVDVMVTPRSGDGGRDVLARRVVHRVPLAFMFECKRYERSKKVRLDAIRALLGAASTRSACVNKAVLVTTSTFTRGGWQMIASEAMLEGKDYDGIVDWIRDCA